MACKQFCLGPLHLKGHGLLSGLFFPYDFTIGAQCLAQRKRASFGELVSASRDGQALDLKAFPKATSVPCFLLTRPVWNKLLTVLPVELGAEESRDLGRGGGGMKRDR